MLNSNCSTSIINLSTRLTSSSATVLDHIITHENRHEIIPSVIDYDITDLYPVMAIINRNVTSNPSQPIFIRSFNKFNSSNFINDLQLRLDNFFPQMNTITKNNINDVFDEFYSLITKTISNQAPQKKLSRKQKRLKSNPWMTKGLITVSTLLVWKANGFYARGSVIAFKIAPPSKGGGSHNFMHSKQYKFCRISDWICTVK